MIKRCILLILILFSGCATINQTIYLQNVEVNGPLNNPPVFITGEKNGIKISPHLTFNSINQVTGRANHTMVNSQGFFLVDTLHQGGQTLYRESSGNGYNYNQNNLKWNIPQVSVGVDVDLPISNSVSLFGSLNYSSQNLYDLVGGAFGLGFSSVSNGGALRFNFGASVQQYQYDAATVVVSKVDPFFGEKYTQVDFYHDINKKSNLDFFGNLTYNTISKTMPVNFFLSLAWFSQTILNFTPETPSTEYYPFGVNVTTIDTRGETSTSYLSLTPGIYLNFSQSMQIVLGLNILKDIGNFKEASNPMSASWIIMPLAKIDLMF